MPKPLPRERLTLYSIDRRYGGPEEGGWWYDAPWPMGRKFSWKIPRNASLTHRRKLLDRMRQKFGVNTRSQRYSMLNGLDLEVLHEKRYGARRLRRRPHYE